MPPSLLAVHFMMRHIARGGDAWQTIDMTDTEQQIQPRRFRKKFKEFEPRLMCRIMDSSGAVKLLNVSAAWVGLSGNQGGPDRGRFLF